MVVVEAPWVPLDIRAEHCKGCELCITACPKHCLALDESRVNVLGSGGETSDPDGKCSSATG